MKILDFMVTLMLVAMNSLLFAQQETANKSLEEYLEYLVEIGFEEFEAADFSEEIASLILNPVDINKASEKEIGRLFFLSPFQVKGIINHIRSNGPFKSKFELAYISGFNSELAKLCSNYIIINEINYKGNRSSYTKITGGLIYSDKDTVKYPGSALKVSTRLVHYSGDVLLGCTIDKDHGEKILTDNYKPEFFSAYLQFPLSASKTQFIIGDYRVRFGQGLTVWHGYSPGVSPVNPNLVRGSSRITPYSSSDENNFFRGIAMSSSVSKTNINLYLSSNRIDANLELLPDSGRLVRSLYDSGIHNTALGNSKRDVLSEYSAGLNLNRNFNLFNIGLSITGTIFSENITPCDISGSNMDFKGKSNMVMSVDHAASLNKLYIYGETAVTDKGKIALVQGLRLIPDDRITLNILYAFTSLSYSSYHGHVFGKETVNNFNKSVLVNITIDLAPNLSLHSGIINQKDLWYAYQSAKFPVSTRYMTEIIWEPFDNISLKYSYRQKKYLEDTSVDRGIEISRQASINSNRLHINLKPLEALKLSGRFEISSEPYTGKKGYMAYQGARLDLTHCPLSIITRFYSYYIESFNTRIYAWEDDLLYHPSIPAFIGKGTRGYIVLDYHPENLISIRFKYGISNYVRDKGEASFNEYRIQFRMRFPA